MAENRSEQAPEARAIHLLASEVVDQIAAGEVVERPAHLVKELVENALDAHATSIEIEFDQGGRRVRVTDDGAGIGKDDLKLALSRHATSKIAIADDLWNLGSFGFRGEALASIAAVSRLTLQSRPRGDESAHCISSEFGKLSGVEPVGGNVGTTVLIEELFANVPARLKFMKTEAGEIAQIKATLRALALANEGVEFRLRTKGKLESVWPRTTSFVERARQVMSAETLFDGRGEYMGYEVEAVFASPHDVAGNTRSIALFVQKRWVQDRSLQMAVIEAYRGLLMHGEFPIVAVRLSVPPAEVDVNIHPTKSQVKFRDAQTAFRAVNRTLRASLEKAPWLKRDEAAMTASAPQPEPTRLSVAELTRPYDPPSLGTTPTAMPATQPPGETLATAPVHSVGRFEAPEFDTVMFRQKLDAAASATSVPTDTVAVEPAIQPGPWSRLQVLGQAHLTYILAQDEGRLVLIDQHAAHERVAYEKLMSIWMSSSDSDRGGDVAGRMIQPLLLPITLELEAEGTEALMTAAEDLERIGVVVDQVGPTAVAVRSKPVIIGDAALTKSLNELARDLQERGGSFALEKRISDLCATMACHSVVRAGQALSLEQMRQLLRQMDEFSLSSFCPHGRPVSVEYPFAKIERDFGRIV